MGAQGGRAHRRAMLPLVEAEHQERGRRRVVVVVVDGGAEAEAGRPREAPVPQRLLRGWHDVCVAVLYT